MNNTEFNSRIKTLNLSYKKIFHTIPCVRNFSCTREEFVNALEQSVKMKKEISEFIHSKRTERG